MPPKHVSPGKRSRTGCLTCRERKLKCDEKKPVCGQCSKTGRRCQPSSGIVFRHHQNASMNGASEEDDLGSFYAYRDTFTKDNVWLPVSGPVKFIHIQDPYAEDEMLLDVDRLGQTDDGPHVLQVTDVRAEPGLVGSDLMKPIPGSLASRAFVDLSGHGQERTHRNKSISSLTQSVANSSSPSALHSSTAASPMSPFSATVPPYTPAPTSSEAIPSYRFPISASSVSPLPWSATSANFPFAPPFPIPPKSQSPQIRQYVSRSPHISDEKVLFLLRHFSTVVGFSMDLFDCGRFFSDYVPTRAIKNPLLRNAACAYAAKQLACVKGKRMTVGAFSSRPARTEYWNDPGTVDWGKYANQYYDEAIRHLVQAVNLVNSDPEDVSENWQEGMADAGKSDDLMAATAILCEYEAIDSPGEAWQKHLNGTKSLLDIAEAGMKPLDHIEISKRRPRFSRARRAIFWNFARQDYAAALITEAPARLNVDNHQLWRDAGLELDSNGRLIPNKGMWIEYSEGGVSMREDMLSNGLIMILSKICNYLSTAERLVAPPAGFSARELSALDPNVPMYGLSQQILLQRWNLLNDEVEAWHKHLPDTFKPIGRCRSSSPLFEEILFGIGMCAASVANYHMARILLLINKPQESTMTRSTVGSRMLSYRTIVPECEAHAREICGIALARPETAVRIFMILPLYYAGQCMENPEERKIVAMLLRDIETDLGWSTEYRVQQLLNVWGASEQEVFGDKAISR